MEVELKLLLAPDDAPRLRAHPLLAQSAQGQAQVLHLHDIYVDTPDLQLCRHQAGLRVRQVAGRWLQTLKAGEPVAVLSGPIRARKVQIIHQILAHDRQIRDLVSPWMAELASLINSTSASRKLSTAYGA